MGAPSDTHHHPSAFLPRQAGFLLPFVGRVVADGRHAFEMLVGAWRDADVVVDPDP